MYCNLCVTLQLQHELHQRLIMAHYILNIVGVSYCITSERAIALVRGVFRFVTSAHLQSLCLDLATYVFFCKTELSIVVSSCSGFDL